MKATKWALATSQEVLIHRSAWNRNSAKFGFRILHRSPSKRREGGFLGPPRRMSEIYMLWWCIKIPARE